jgi:cytochrome c biogenesis protein CcmG/thiol:disulfide interchange protein DsbE
VVAAVVVAAVGALTFWVVGDNDGTTSGGVAPHRSDPLPARDAPRAGSPAPDFDLRRLDGGRVSLSGFRGRPVIVNFWASYCRPCRQEFPLLQSTLDAHRDDRLAIVGIDSQDIEGDARAFVKEQRATWPMGFDADNVVSRAYGVRALPQTFFVDREGTIRARIFGEMRAADVQRELKKIIPPT